VAKVPASSPPPLASPSSLPSRTVFVGVDWSGAANPAPTTWVSVLEAGENPLDPPSLRYCLPLAQVPSTRIGRGGQALGKGPAAYLKLLEVLTPEPQAVVGIDASFGLPQALLPPHQPWLEWLATFPQRYPSAEAFRAQCQQQASALGFAGKELRRHTDDVAKTPFSPYNLRHYKQCYSVLTYALRPWVQASKVHVLPFMPPAPNKPSKPWVVEACPASTLALSWGFKQPYKGPSPAAHQGRQALLALVQQQANLRLPIALAEQLAGQPTADGLDSLVIAVRLWQLNTNAPASHPAWVTPAAATLGLKAAQQEGWVYY
jgi:hypothetical protein